MVILNLQRFAYKGNSIVDYLKSEGKDSSLSARKTIADSLGISNYTGTSSQNTQMLNALRNGSGSTSNKTNTSTKTNTNNKTNTNKTNTNKATNTNTKSNISGVDQSVINTINTPFSQSNKVTDKYSEADKNLENYKNLINTDNIIDQSTWDALNSKFVVPEAVTQADAWLTSQLEKIQSGRTSYTDQINDLMSQIMNREDFEYDVDKDTLFQQALSSAMSSGRTAMQDTIGQASALTGGYGSTYATSAGNQAYNAYIEDAYNNLPEYYQMALEAYQMEGQEMYNQLGMLNEADANEWNKLVTGYDATSQYRNQIYNEAYNSWQDSVNNAYNSANLQLSEYGQRVNDAYNLYGISKDSADTLYAQEYQTWQDKVNNAYNMANLQQTDYWNTTEYDYKVERDKVADNQWQQSFNHQKEQDRIAQSNWEKEYNLDLASNNAKVDKKGNVTVDKKPEVKEGYVQRTDENGNLVTYKTPTETQMKNALNAYNEGGDKGLDKYVDSLPNNIDVETIFSYVDKYGETKWYDKIANWFK